MEANSDKLRGGREERKNERKNERMKERKRAREQEGERERKRRTKGQPSVKDFLSVTWCETSGPVYRQRFSHR